MKLTIVVPMYNEERFIRKMLDALIAALQEIQKIQQAVKQAQEMTERAESDIEGYVYSSWNDEFEVDFDTE